MYVHIGTVGQLQAKLHPFKVEKLDACVRSFYQIWTQMFSILRIYCTIFVGSCDDLCIMNIITYTVPILKTHVLCIIYMHKMKFSCVFYAQIISNIVLFARLNKLVKYIRM